MSPAHRNQDGFTLVELMVSVSLIALVSLILVTMVNSTAATWRYTTSRIEQFRGAETAFESITRRLSQATLNTYWGYDNVTAPKKYLRLSDLRFIAGNTQTLLGSATPRRPTHSVFFQAPLGYVDDTTNFSGLENLLNTWGYYVEFNSDAQVRPSFVTTAIAPARYRYRLMELMQSSNTLSVYSYTSGNPTYNSTTWFTTPMKAASPPTHILAENIVALVILPKLSPLADPTGTKLAPNYSYDSTATNSDPTINPQSQLPPVVQVTMVAIDELSAARSISSSGSLPAFDNSLNSVFTTAKNFNTDLTSLQNTLLHPPSGPPINFRVFTTNVSIRGAKWSTN